MLYEPQTDPIVALEKAYFSGQFFGDDELSELTFEQVQSLHHDERLARRVWNSWRRSDANYDKFLLENHPQRHSVIQHDSTFGPATEALVTLERCPLPDNPIPKTLDLETLAFPDLETKAIWQNSRDFAGVQWPKGCINPDDHRSGLDFSDRYAISIYINTDGISSRWQANLKQLCLTNQKIYADIGIVVRYYIDGVPLDGLGVHPIEPNNCEISKTFGNIPGGVIGWNYFPEGTCNTTIPGKLDSSWNVNLDGHTTLEWHETGHGVGEQHTRGGIMNPSMIFGMNYSWRGQPSERSIVSKYDGNSVSQTPLGIDPVGPDPLDPTDPVDFNPSSGVFMLDGKVYSFVIGNPNDLDKNNGIFVFNNQLVGISINDQ